METLDLLMDLIGIDVIFEPCDPRENGFIPDS